ncbi:zinc finger protein 862-like [Diadema antillarum]|uniref:zinc finger protein 862-like n=1 Tax=Diadema antillarum TaxID=105358 RepID=UPI003A8555A2
MWRYMNVSNPELEAKKRRTEKDRQYEQTARVRNYRKEWERDHTWLRYNEEEKVMFCTVCRETQTKGAVGGRGQNLFYVGCKNLKLEAVKKHETSENHRVALRIKAANDAPPGTSQAEKAIRKMNETVVNRLTHLFRNAHAISKQCRPFTDFVWLCKLDEAKGIDIGTAYRTDKYAQVFTHYIAKAERLKMQKRVEESSFFSVISDGTTDASVTEDEIVYLRHAKDGKIHLEFVAVTGVITADSKSITDAIIRALSDHLGITPEGMSRKMVGFGSDGANVMLGKNNGVSTRLRELNPELQAVHCTAHRLELAFKDAMKKAPLCNNVNTLLQSLYLYYKYSSKNRSALKEAAEAVGAPIAIPTRVGGTRWLPHMERALKTLVKGYRALVTHLHQIEVQPGYTNDARAKAKGYLRLLERRDVLMYSLFLLDVVTVLSKVSLTGQKQVSTLADVSAAIEASQVTLRKYKNRMSSPGMLEFHRCFGDEDLTRDVNIEVGIRDLLDGLETSLTGRFNDMNEGVLDAWRIASFDFWPEENEDAFGDEAVRTLGEHFKSSLEGAGVNRGKLAVEWDLLKARIHSKKGQDWSSIIPALRDQLPNICCLLDLMLSVPASSADAERGFSRLNLVKSNLRSVMGDDRVTDQLLIMLHAADISEYDPEQAISLWHSGGSRTRRPDSHHHSPSHSEDDQSSDEQD